MPTRTSQAIGGFAQYLHGENIRLREEDKRQRQNLASQSIADAYLGLGPDADEEDVRRLTFEMIDDAASLDVMKESLPLIQSLYSESLQSMQRRKAETIEDALHDYVEGTLEFDIPDELPGSVGFELYKDERSQDFTQQIVEDDATYLAKFDQNLKEKGERIRIGPGSDEIFEQQSKLKRSGIQNIKPAPMLTDTGLPVFWEGRTLYTQVGGKAEVYDEAIHGRLFRGTKTQLDYTLKEELGLKGRKGTAYQSMESAARKLNETISITPKKDPGTRLPTTDKLSYSETLLSKTDEEVESKLNDIKGAGARDLAWDLWALFKEERGKYLQADSQYEEVSTERDYQTAMEEFGVTRDEFIYIENNYSGATYDPVAGTLATPLYNIRDEQGFLTEDAKGRRFLMGQISGKPVKTEKEKIRLTNTSDQRMLEMWNALTTREKAEYIKEWKDLPDSE